MGTDPTGLGLGIGGVGSTITVILGVTLRSLTCDPNTVATPGTSACTASLSASAPAGGVTLAIGSSNTSLSVPASVTVTAGSASTTFTASAASVSTNQPATVTASLGSSSQSASLTLTAPVTVSGLVGAYSFNEGTGTTVTDLSGNGNTGTIIGAAWTAAGKYGNALFFNGVNSYVDLGNPASLGLTGSMTWSAWVNSAANPADDGQIIAKSDDGPGWQFKTSPDTGPRTFGVGVSGAGASRTQRYSMTVPLLNTWYHVAGVYDASGGALNIYVNGVLDNGVLVGTVPASQVNSSVNVNIGRRTGGYYFNGVLDEVRIYNRALAQSEIQADMNAPLGSGSSGPHPSAVMSSSTSDSGNHATGTASAKGASLTNTGTIGPTGAGTASDLLSISPRVSALTFTRTQQFNASKSDGAVSWLVDGVVGGSAASGTISTTGLYSPPGSAGAHTVTAMDQSNSVSATVYISNYPGTFTRDVDTLRTGLNSNETVLTPANVNAEQFGKLFSYPLDGVSDASSLYVANVSIPGQGFHNVVYVATEHDTVYAFDADGLSGNPLWKTSFINPAAGITTFPPGDTGECCDISPEIGITGSPVIDQATGTLYVVAKTKEVSGSTTNYVHRLHALDISTGIEKFGGPVVIQASVPGNGAGASGGQTPFVSLHENQRAALLLSNGVVYFAFAAHGDQPPYRWVLGYNATTLQQTMVYNSTPNGNGGGARQSGDGLATDSSGNIYFVNGDGDSFVKISPRGVVLDYFTPHDQANMQAPDLDLGSGGVLLLPNQSGPHTHLAISAGKNGTIYLVDRDNMGRFNANNGNQIVQSLVNVFPNGTLITGNFKAPLYFNGSVYFSADQDTVKNFKVTNGLLSTSPTSQTSQIPGYPVSTLSISANGNTNGILWAVQRNDFEPTRGGGRTSPGVLHAFDATNLGIELYNSNQAAGSRDALDFATKWSSVLVANGKVFVATNAQLIVFSLLP